MKKRVLVGMLICIFILSGIFIVISKNTVATNSKVSPTKIQVAIDPPNS